MTNDVYLIGTDEAGYGPNLGPLVISASVWRVPGELRRADLYDVLGEVVSAVPVPGDRVRSVLADSKLLYKPGGGLGGLERGLLPLLALLPCPASGTGSPGAVGRWRDLWPVLAADSLAPLDSVPWYAGYDAPLPCDADGADIGRLTEALGRGLRKAGVSLQALRSTVLFAERFNELVEQHGNKAALLSQASLMLVRQLLQSLDPLPVRISCDKHGGRNKYGPLLQRLFPEHVVEIHKESRLQSVYRWGPPQRRVEIEFRVRGETFLASALASMTSKYLRELAMQAFNAFWCRQLPGLKPTAGYPQDARRFRTQIQPLLVELGIEERCLWRSR